LFLLAFACKITEKVPFYIFFWPFFVENQLSFYGGQASCGKKEAALKKSEGFGRFVRRLRTGRPKASD
jgi:hypothetical protein